ncbi:MULTISPECIES: SCO family protein [Oceanobacillus]|uniref:SCO1 protein n=1 Tax=Oceanobacillus kimchii TaxID=746691 RepID=A0ABQ5TJT0_9BACI|nr:MULTISPECIES: SCO family protein [Oceanobacillus]MBT2598866.1 SCO family protein [Oceanobacillus sp. ISL-74]MBT2651785.1 SCO family protein [Oceanobacillus sp. ISL-73]OEH54510.1 cytochrome c oxidase assembly protein [Oceanobacillus sp. E9]GLO65839.1 SCO1 protein [Oceanobacillus kimchii]
MRNLILLLLLSMVLVGCGEDYNIESTMSEKVTDFQFTNQDNEAVSLGDLEGEWWVANFIFTNCTTVCMPMTYNMSQLQEMIETENLDVQLISFSVDPENDSPEVLKEYAQNYDASFDNWSLLTGYEFETIRELSIKSFKNFVQAPPEGTDQVTHGTSFFLVSPEGEVIKNYNGIEEQSMETIVQDLNKVQ